MKIVDPITVEEMVIWCRKEQIDLGTNPRRKLVHLASTGIIPKSVKGPQCKGIYEREEVQSRLRFYHTCKKKNWRTKDIAKRLEQFDYHPPANTSSPSSDAVKEQESDSLSMLPFAVHFRRQFESLIREYPAEAKDILHFFDEQENILGIRIGSSFRRFIGLESSVDGHSQLHMRLWDN